ncbi:MAG TPA: S9 family peptidase [Vicinamibacterales bacterium]
MLTKTRLLAAATALAAVGTLTLSAQTPQRAGRKLFTYEQVFEVPTGMAAAMDGRDPSGVLGDVPAVTGWLDDEHYLETRRDADGRRRVYAVNAATGEERIHRESAGPGNGAQYAKDGSFSVYARDNDLYYATRDGSVTRRLTANAGEEKHLRLSPDGRFVAYTRDHDLFVYDLETGLERQLTNDGSEVIRNGDPSWVYMEEIIGRGSNAFWWAPDSRRLVFMRFDDSPVPTFPIYHADGQHGRLEIQRYPKAGDPNPWVKMGVVSAVDGTTVWMDFEEKADHYVAWPSWSSDGSTLFVQWMNRAQDTIRLFACDPATGRKTQLLEEKQSAWVDWYKDLHHLKNGSFVLISDVDGWEHIYHYTPTGALERRLTSGEWRVNSIELVDEKNGWVYFVGRPVRSWDAQLMRVRLTGGEPQILTRGEGVHRVHVSPGGSWFVDSVSTLSSPTRVSLHRTDGTLVRALGDAGKAPGVGDYAWGRTELFTIPSEDGAFALPAYWVLPPDFSPSKQYPVIFSIYGGPDAGRVHNSWPGLQPHYWAQRGVITISVDHRGSGHFGKKGVALMHRRLGKWEMTDLITAAKWLRTKPFVAKDRIAITGGSYGGYVTLMALTYGAGHFNYGVSSAPVTDWRLYDSVYTERYMDAPDENPDGYTQGSVLTYLDRYKGGLRLTHGSIDDNVHLQNTLQVVDWLTTSNRRFELMIYPDSRHGLQASQRAHAARETHDFWVRNLLGGKLPHEAPDTSARAH